MNGTINTDATTVDKADAVVEEIRQSGGRAIAIIGNMVEAAFITKLVQEAADFGGGKIHIIVNNAGYTWDGMVHKVKPRITHISRQADEIDFNTSTSDDR